MGEIQSAMRYMRSPLAKGATKGAASIIAPPALVPALPSPEDARRALPTGRPRLRFTWSSRESRLLLGPLTAETVDVAGEDEVIKYEFSLTPAWHQSLLQAGCSGPSIATRTHCSVPQCSLHWCCPILWRGVTGSRVDGCCRDGKRQGRCQDGLSGCTKRLNRQGRRRGAECKGYNVAGREGFVLTGLL